MDSYIIEMDNIEKNFDFIKAVNKSHFDLKKGEIHSLIGENGAGKSTMMKILYGIHPLDNGTIKIKGKIAKDLTPKKSIDSGIGMVHQEFMLVNELTVLENIILGFEPKKKIVIDFVKARSLIQKYIDDYNMDIQLNKRIDQISLGEAQRVEIIKTLYRGAEILILDEPTAVLTPIETLKFFEILKNLRNDGKSIIFISHKLNEVMEISDRITVMRQGEYVGTVLRDDTSPAELAKMMVGREVLLRVEKEEGQPGEMILEVRNLWASGEKELSKIRGVDLEVRAGEIVGIAGIDGNGQSELIEAITGLREVERGEILLQGKSIANKSPLAIRRAGMSHIPENRNLRGLNRGLSIMDNLIALNIDQFPYSKGIALKKEAIQNYAVKLIERFDVRPTDPFYSTEALSGGNAQKIVVAREVDAESVMLIASQPTRGVDIGAIESIRRILNEVKIQGRGILLVSADLEEVLSLSDRIVVMYEGKITGELLARDANRNNVGVLMMGGKEVIEDDVEILGGTE
jgi:simple sugar transport system ATP-binding protein